MSAAPCDGANGLSDSIGKDPFRVKKEPGLDGAGYVRVEGVTKTFAEVNRAFAALDDVSFSVGKGEFLCLIGPTGCGKSTLLDIIGGFARPDSGRVLVDGQPVIEPGPERGVVFQEHGLFPWMSVLDNVTYGPRIRGLRRALVEKRAFELLDQVGLREAATKFPVELSGGMRQRVAIARVLINEPKVLLMDEPFGALDALTRATMQDLLLSLWDAVQLTVIFVTHDIEEATLLGDRVIVMSAGPGRVRSVCTVPFGRPRRYGEIVGTVEHTDLKVSLTELLR